MKRTGLLLLIAVLLIGAIAGIAFAFGRTNDADEEVYVPEEDVILEEDEDEFYEEDESLIDAEIPMIPDYYSIMGTIMSVEEIDDMIRVTIEDEYENPAVFVLSENTIFPFEKEFEVGDVITGWYATNAPMILIWPAEYTIAVLAAGAPEDANITVDRFDVWEDSTEDMMISHDGLFAFRTDADTEIVLANGDDFTGGDLAGRRIVVVYDISTRGIPETATARFVIVLYEDIVAFDDFAIDATGWPILVNGDVIEAPDAFQTEDGFVMVPLVTIATALGYEPVWDVDADTVTLDDTITVTIGSIHFDGIDASLQMMPMVVDGNVYVPLQFFTDILGMANAFAFEGKIDIMSEGERME